MINSNINYVLIFILIIFFIKNNIFKIFIILILLNKIYFLEIYNIKYLIKKKIL